MKSAQNMIEKDTKKEEILSDDDKKPQKDGLTAPIKTIEVNILTFYTALSKFVLQIGIKFRHIHAN